MCGGTVVLDELRSVESGLSPRVRGNRMQHYPPSVDVRSIPACAGEPETCVEFTVCMRVYPRVCGGTCRSHAQAGTQDGLSPRVRGNLRLLPSTSLRTRSIPACAGEPDGLVKAGVLLKVYPRVCGGTELRLVERW